MNHIATSTALGPVLQPQSFAELVQFAKMAANSDLMPKDYRGKPENIMLAVQMGSEVGLSPMQAIQNIAVINGRPSLWGDAMLALIRRDLRCEDVVETIAGEGDARVARCIITRRGATPVEAKFSVADAKKAGLWGKAGPWTQYPDRMMQMRARGFAGRDAFPDVLKGLQSAEEARDIPVETFRGTTVDVAPLTAGEAIGDAIPAHVMDPMNDPLRDRVDAAIKTAARAATDMQATAVEAKCRALFADIETAGREDLKAMLADTLAAMVERVKASAPADMDMPA